MAERRLKEIMCLLCYSAAVIIIAGSLVFADSNDHYRAGMKSTGKKPGYAEKCHQNGRTIRTESA